jgi:hypothetical protein
LQILLIIKLQKVPILVAARTKTWVCGHAATGIAGSNPAECVDVSCVCVVQGEVSAKGRSLVQGFLPSVVFLCMCVCVCVCVVECGQVQQYSSTPTMSR